MGYQRCLKFAGAEVLEFRTFGTYQGDWWAYVTYEGETFWVHGCFGSCSYCDAFEAEFDCFNGCEKHRYYSNDFPMEGCEACAERVHQMADFGLRYLTKERFSQEEAEEKARTYAGWDGNAEIMMGYIKSKREKTN